jgi:hypothetical protein
MEPVVETMPKVSIIFSMQRSTTPVVLPLLVPPRHVTRSRHTIISHVRAVSAVCAVSKKSRGARA